VLYFLIVNFWSKHLIRQQLSTDEFIRHQPPVFVVNNSSGETVDQDYLLYPNLNILEPGENLGFGAGCNFGLRHIYEFDSEAVVWLLNPDAQLFSGAISYVKKCLYRYSDIAILGTRIQDNHGQPWFDVGRFNPFLGTLPHRGGVVSKRPRTPDIIPSRWVTGCSMILNFAQFSQVPLFDPIYFLYYEDNDLCETYHRQGYKIAVTQDTLVVHYVSSMANQNLGLKWQHATFSKLYFLRKYATFWALGLNLGYLLLKVLIDLCRGDVLIAQGRMEGLRQFITLKSCPVVEDRH
jgi:N-acetylglucosaminyl-diphospho-decaprenol L-rhamnosyltransferase